MVRASKLIHPAAQVTQAAALVEGLCVACEGIAQPDCQHCPVHTAKRALASLVVYEAPAAPAAPAAKGCSSGGCGVKR